MAGALKTAGAVSYKLQDLVDIQKFQFLQDRLNSIYPFPSAIIDNDGVVLTAAAWQDVCMQFHRKNPECQRDCIKSDTYIVEHIHEANPGISYTCPRGMVDCALPIIINGVHYANFFTGQFFTQSPDHNFFSQQARRFGFDESAYLAAVDKVPVWSQAQIDDYLYFIQGLIAIITEAGSKKLQELEALEQFRISQKHAQSILQQMPDGFWAINQQEGRVMEVNQALCSLLGYTRQELLALTVADVEAQDNPEQIRERIAKILLSGSDNFESILRRKDGSLVDVEISINYLPDIGQFYAFFRDITQRKAAERALRENEARLSAIIGVSRDAIGVSNAGIHVLVNPAYLQLFGFDSAAELVGTPILNLIAPEAREEVARNVRKRGKQESVPSFYETTALRRDGTKFLMEVNVSSYNHAGEVYTVVTLRDITERKRSEETIRSSLAEKETLLRELYHRTKNNMQVITAMLELQAANVGDPLITTLFQEMENRISTMALVHQMLYKAHDLSRINLGEYIRELLHLLAESYAVSMGRVKIDLDLEDIPVLIDTAIPCGLILNELVTNAVKYAFPAGRPGTLHVALRRLDAQVLELVFADDGAGVPPGFDFRRQSTLGMKTVVTLVEHQLQGKVEFDGSRGAAWRLHLKDGLYEVRV